jgi:hypothetical protein
LAALGLFTPDECANYARHCGYRISVEYQDISLTRKMRRTEAMHAWSGL